MKDLKELFGVPNARPVSWTQRERQAFLLFFRSGTGIKFFEFLRQYAAGVTYDAVRQDRVAVNAYARGVQDTVHLIINMADDPGIDTGVGLPFDENLEPLPSENGWQSKGASLSGGHSAI